jgi:hypothetical protein
LAFRFNLSLAGEQRILSGLIAVLVIKTPSTLRLKRANMGVERMIFFSRA